MEESSAMEVDNVVSKEISQKDFLLYLRFAKKLNPKFTKEAADQLRQEYLTLRQGDITAQKSSYRITVRQLESLVRLSEALARVHLDEVIHPTYVIEASKLLKNSILPVDMPKIEFENEFETNLQEDRRRHAENNQNQDIVMMDAENEKKDQKLFMTGFEYEKWKTRIVLLIHEFENNGKIPNLFF
jgi:DNA replication licensing factor MCM6